MTKEYDTVLQAKKNVTAHMDFFETLLQHLKGTNKLLRNRAVWAAWCLDQYINYHLITDMNEAIRLHTPKEQDNIQ